ncbi:hypothetical protein [Burkholderia lata]|uniref:hypothetical protein n=1 Tax=Burkholderia lata (strain ATCC 17760 / DSM 23089 / LMG 22485 / NCIMB 9086 / R18194 / 383) TaxID=482957 RepID=UPI001581EDFE|nr:hypothetical protein [Burkholderia lata]
MPLAINGTSEIGSTRMHSRKERCQVVHLADDVITHTYYETGCQARRVKQEHTSAPPPKFGRAFACLDNAPNQFRQLLARGTGQRSVPAWEQQADDLPDQRIGISVLERREVLLGFAMHKQHDLLIDFGMCVYPCIPLGHLTGPPAGPLVPDKAGFLAQPVAQGPAQECRIPPLPHGLGPFANRKQHNGIANHLARLRAKMLVTRYSIGNHRTIGVAMIDRIERCIWIDNYMLDQAAVSRRQIRSVGGPTDPTKAQQK